MLELALKCEQLLRPKAGAGGGDRGTHRGKGLEWKEDGAFEGHVMGVGEGRVGVALGELLLVLYKPLGTRRVSRTGGQAEGKHLGVFGKRGTCRAPTRFPAAAPGTSHSVPLRSSPGAQTWGTPWRH